MPDSSAAASREALLEGRVLALESRLALLESASAEKDEDGAAGVVQHGGASPYLGASLPARPDSKVRARGVKSLEFLKDSPGVLSLYGFDPGDGEGRSAEMLELEKSGSDTAVSPDGYSFAVRDDAGRALVWRRISVPLPSEDGGGCCGCCGESDDSGESDGGESAPYCGNPVNGSPDDDDINPLDR